MMGQETVLDQLNYFGSLFLAIDKSMCNWVRVERPDDGSSLIVDVFFHNCTYFKLYLLSRTDTCHAENFLPRLVTNPSSFNRLAISLRL